MSRSSGGEEKKNMENYTLEKCLRGDCKGCDREHYASCDLIIEALREEKQDEKHA